MINFGYLNYEQTGGGVFTYWGQISKKRWFCYCLDTLYFYDADINDALMKEFYSEDEENWSMYDWEEEHLIWKYERRFENGEEDKEKFVEDFLEQMFNKLIEVYRGYIKEISDLRYEEIGY